MRQATLPWAAPPAPLASTSEQQQQSFDPYYQVQQQQQQHLLPPGQLYDATAVALDPALFDVDTPPLSQKATQAPDPALSASAQDEPQQIIDISTPEPIPQPEEQPATMTASASSNSSSSSSSTATTSTSVPVFTQQTTLSVAPEPASAPTAEPVASTSKPQPALHPFFQPGGSNSSLPSSEDASDSQEKRPSRSSRTKAPVSYREDLKAVLRADAAQESARLKQEKREASATRKAQRSGKAKGGEATNDKQRENGDNGDGFEILESRSSKKASEPEVAATGENAASSSKPQEKKAVEPKPLSLAVKGTGAVASSAHPFFTKKAKQPPPAEAESGASKNTANPVEAGEADGEKGKTRIKSSAFDATPASWSLFSAPRISSGKPKKPVNAPWPTSDDTHVTGLHQSESSLLSAAHSDLDAFRSRFQSYSPRPFKSSTSQSPPPSPRDFIFQLNHTRPQPVEHSLTLDSTPETKFDSIDDFLASSVNISSLPSSLTLASSTSTPTRTQMWTDLFHPHSAPSCLGNESNASYLLEWLRRLLVAAPNSVQTKDKKKGKRKGVQRRVDKKAKRRRGSSDDESDLDDFIVDDDEDEDAIGEWDPEYDDEVFGRFGRIEPSVHLTDDEVSLAASQGSTSLPATTAAVGLNPSSQQDQRYASLDRLTDCIVLSGNSGTSKTASIYACASQLGYEVFELYPGMGKRSGKELLAAVGDLGRNHMVSSGGVGGGATFKPHPTTSSCLGGEAKAVRQSLILIEEADILFEEDKGFWPAVVELVAESKRPVVITCNDLELVPVHDLPVQEVLEFHSPSLGDAVPWLQVIAARMGKYLSSESVTQLLLDLPGTETALRVGEEEEQGLRIDIRQAITQLQFGQISSRSHKPEQPDAVHLLASANTPLLDMKAIASAAESASVADIFETTLQGDGIEAFGDAGLEQSCSRQWGGWTQLVPQPLARLHHHHQQQALYAAELEYRSVFTQLHLQQSALRPPPPHSNIASGISTEKMAKARKNQTGQIRQMLLPIFKHLPQSAQLARQHIVDYAPFVRLMALVDDDLARIHASLHEQAALSSSDSSLPTLTLAGGGRTTRNSSRLTWLAGGGENGGYERWLWMIGADQVDAAKGTNLVF